MVGFSVALEGRVYQAKSYILGLLCSMGAGLWVLDTGLGWAKYLSVLGMCLDSRLAWVLG